MEDGLASGFARPPKHNEPGWGCVMSEKIIQSDQHKDKPSEEALARAKRWVERLLREGEPADDAGEKRTAREESDG